MTRQVNSTQAYVNCNVLVSNIGSLLRNLLSSVLILCLALTATVLICSQNDKTEFTQTPKSVQDKTRDKKYYSLNNIQMRQTGGRNLPFSITLAIGFYNSLYYRTSRDTRQAIYSAEHSL